MNFEAAVSHINEHFNILDVIRDYGHEPLPAGESRWRLLCPFHSDSLPSLIVYEENQSWFCFGCRSGTDIVEWVRREENVSFVEAIKILVGEDLKASNNFLKKRALKLQEQKKDPEEKILRELNFSITRALREFSKSNFEWVDEQFLRIDRFLAEKPPIEKAQIFFKDLLKEITVNAA